MGQLRDIASRSERRRTAGRSRRPLWVLAPLTCLVASSTLILAAGAQASGRIECQHPVMTGVEIYKLHNVSSREACPVALALFRWDDTESHETVLYGCHAVFHPYLRLHHFHGWRLSLTPDFVMSRGHASFDVEGTDFPINCT